MGEIRSDDAPTSLLAITTPAWTMSPWRTFRCDAVAGRLKVEMSVSDPG
jgi:hypothetical protein